MNPIDFRYVFEPCVNESQTDAWFSLYLVLMTHYSHTSQVSPTGVRLKNKHGMIFHSWYETEITSFQWRFYKHWLKRLQKNTAEEL